MTTDLQTTDQHAVAVHRTLNLIDNKSRFDAYLGSPQEATRFMVGLEDQVRNSESLQKCSPPEILRAGLKIAMMKLSLDPSLGEAHLIPRRNTKLSIGGKEVFDITVQRGYKGVLKMAMNSDLISNVRCEVVHEKDIFDYETGDDPYVRHKQSLLKDPGPLVAVFCVIKLKDGAVIPKIMGWEQVEEHAKAFSDAYKKNSGPWKHKISRQAMGMKTVLLQALKMIPQLAESVRSMVSEEEMVDLGLEPTGTGDTASGIASATNESVDELKENMDQGSEAQAGAVEAEVISDEQKEIDETRKTIEDALGDDCVLTGEQVQEWNRWLDTHPDVKTLREGLVTLVKMIEGTNKKIADANEESTDSAPTEESTKKPTKSPKDQLIELLEDNRGNNIVVEEEYIEMMELLEDKPKPAWIKGQITEWTQVIKDRAEMKADEAGTGAQTSLIKDDK